MGVEYIHAFLVHDLEWQPTIDAARAVVEVLEEHGVVAGKPTIRDVANGKWKKARSQSLAPGKTLPDHCALQWEGLAIDGEDRAEAIAKVMGPSWYAEVTDDQRYLQTVTLVLGGDFRSIDNVFASDYYEVEVTSPPMASGTVIEPLSETTGDVYSGRVWPADFNATPPVATLHVRPDWPPPLPSGFSGIWRAGLFLDCGKDVPRIVEQSSALPGSAFVAALAAALDAPLAQVGWTY